MRFWALIGLRQTPAWSAPQASFISRQDNAFKSKFRENRQLLIPDAKKKEKKNLGLNESDGGALNY